MSGGGEPYHFINVHLDDISPRWRHKQMETVCEIAEKAVKCVIAGDFNHPYRKDSRLYDIPGFEALNKSATTYFIESNMNIDNILVKGFRESSLLNHRVKNSIQDLGSDHTPVIGLV